MSAGKLTDFVDERGFEQLEQVFQKLGIVRQEMIDGIAVARQYNDAIGNSKSLSEFAVASNNATVAMQKVQAANEAVFATQKEIATQTDALVNKTAQNLLIAEQKKQDAAEKTLNNYLVLQSKQNAAAEAQMNKEIAIANQKAQKLIEIEQQAQAKIEAIQAKRAAAIGPTIVGGSDDSRELTIQEAEAIGAKTAAEQDERVAAILSAQAENQRTVAVVESTAAIEKEVISLTEGQQVLATYGGSLESNIALLIQQRLELSTISNQIKKNEGDVVQLTREHMELNAAISQNAAMVKLQAQEEVAAAGSRDEAMAQLAQYKLLYSSLTAEEKTNAEIGGVVNTEIQRLSASTQEAGKSAGIAEKFFGVLDRQLLRLAAHFVLMTVAFAAITWLYDWIKGFDIFTGRLNQAVQNLQALNEVQKNVANSAGESVGKFRILSDTVNDGTIAYKDRLAAATEMKKLWPLELEHSSAQAIANGTEAESLKKLADSVVNLAKAKAAALQIEKVEGEITALQIQKDKIDNAHHNELANISAAKGLDVQFKTRGGNERAVLKQESDQRAKDAKEDADKQIAIKTNTIKYLEKYGGLVNEAKTIEGEPKKGKKGPKDKTIDDDIANQKAHLELEKEIAKQILDSDKSSYEARLAALKVYVARSNQIIDLELKDKNSKPGISATKKDTNDTQAKTQKLGVADFLNSETLKIQKEAIAEFKRTFEELQNDTLVDLQDSLDSQLIAIKTNETNAETVLLERYKRGKINEQQYNRDLKIIRDQANIERIEAEKKTDEAILGIDEALGLASVITGLPIGNTSAKSTQRAKNKVATDANRLQDAKNTLNTDSSKGDDKNQKDKTKEILDFAKEAVQALDLVNSLIDQNAQAKIDALQHQSELIALNAKAEKDQVNNSILSSKEKARENAIIDAQAVAAQQKIAEQQKKIKQDEAKFNKAVSIANIIEGTAVAVVNALAIPVYGEALAIVIGAIGAAQLAVVSAQPIPQYFTGTPHSKEGFAHVGERGTELMIDPSGRMSLTPETDTITYLKKGTKIINNSELMRMVGKPEPIMYGNGQTTDTRKMEKLLEENNNLLRKQKTPVVNVKVGDRWGAYSQQRNY